MMEVANQLLCVLFSIIVIQVISSTGAEERYGKDPMIAKSHKSYFNVPVRETGGRRKREITYDGTVVNFSAQDKTDILNRHLDLRSKVTPGAANMEFMYWDDDLATMGETWSSACIWEHDEGRLNNISPYDSFGQNLWLGGGTLGSPPNGIGPVNAWYNEVSDYDYDTHGCSGVCGHYTQVVWAKSIYVGCGRAFCGDVSNGQYTNAWILTCHYAPAGNYQGVRPYISGPSCTLCGSGSGTCHEDMCRNCTKDGITCDCRAVCKNCGTLNEDDCTCACQDGWYKPDCSRECANYHENCGKNPGWPGPGSCSLHASIPVNCPLMCGICNAATGDETCDEGGNMRNYTVPARVSGNLKIKRRFNNGLYKPSSKVYRDFASKFIQHMNQMMNAEYGRKFEGTVVNKFRKCNPQPCISVDFTLKFHDDPSLSPEVPVEDRNNTVKVVLTSLRDATNMGSLGPLPVQMGSADVGAPRVYTETRVVTKDQKGGFIGEVQIPVPVTTTGWTVTLKFPRAVYSLRICNAEVTSKEQKGQVYRLRNQPWNAALPEDSTLTLWFWADHFNKIKGGFKAEVTFVPITA